MRRARKERRFKLKYAVLGEGITEQWYLSHLKKYKGYIYNIRPSLFADVSIEKAEGIIDELLSGGCDQITFLTDYDSIVNQGKKDVFDKIVDKYKDIEEVLICDSMPSIEYWFLLHFKYTTKEYLNCEQVIKDLKTHISDYSKKEVYLKQDKWFKRLIANDGLNKAIRNANNGLKQYEKGNVGDHFPFSKIHEALNAFENHIKKK
ncbi:RloB domain-containing protein [Plebeiibacterium marinum]|uniref:RloB family protein n=1 Tax=Plebeiibacterium marinum TaxID=2992111 RepID=A0AAE3MGB2_9BACT|nr:RloB domain-containing protein [Plebeiobacterium marinum]MCW3807066.1 RloB family protein [Plebeiobacterium marinum]